MKTFKDSNAKFGFMLSHKSSVLQRLWGMNLFSMFVCLTVMILFGGVGCSEKSNPVSAGAEPETISCLYVGNISGTYYRPNSGLGCFGCEGGSTPFDTEAYIITDPHESDYTGSLRIIMGYKATHKPSSTYLYSDPPDIPITYSARIAWIVDVQAGRSAWKIDRIKEGERFVGNGRYTDSIITGTYQRYRLYSDGTEFMYESGHFSGEMGCLRDSDWPNGETPDWASGPYAQDTAEIEIVTGLFAITWDGKQYIAAGAGILTSPDAYNWTFRKSVGSGTIRDIIVGDDLLLGVGDKKTLVRSSDGCLWESVFSSDNLPGFIGQGGAWSGERYVVISAGSILTSTDGYTWTRSYQQFAPSARGVFWTGENFVIWGTLDWSDNRILISSDGLNWTAISLEPESFIFRDMEYKDKKFVAVRNNSNTAELYTSPNAAEWEYLCGIDSCHAISLAWSGDQFVIFGTREPNSGIYMGFTSADGVTWERISLDIDYPIFEVEWLNNRFVAVGGNRVLISMDGSKWQQVLIGE